MKRILFLCRDRLQTNRAGDTIQIEQTKQALEQLNAKVDLMTTSQAEKAGSFVGRFYDGMHLFNLIPVEETWRQARIAERLGIPYALSTIYWNIEEYLQKGGERSASARIWWRETQTIRRLLAENAQILLPNSLAEKELLLKDFGEDLVWKMHIVPNAVDVTLSDVGPEKFRTQFGVKGQFVLCVGRIVRRKNQLALIRALQGTNFQLILIGPVNDMEYFRECQAEAGDKVHFIPELTPGLLASAYAAARVHALVSWYDTPGLVSLEAALMNCRIVTTDRGPTREYFGEDAFYCSPDSIESIKNAVINAWKSSAKSNLRDKIIKNYSWQKAAMATLNAYNHFEKAGVKPRLLGKG